MAEFNIPSDDDFEDDVETLDKQMLFERRKELLTQSQVSQPKKDNPAISTAVSSAKTIDNAAAGSTRCVDQAQLSNSKPFADDGKVTVSTVVDTKQTADRPDTSADPFKAGSAAASGAYAGYRILVNRKQKGNPILKFVRNVPWEFDNIIPDYDLGRCACALYLSVKYHNRFPEYIHNRLKELGKSYELRILLVQVDTKQQDISHELNQLAKICILADCTMILAFSLEEAGRYLELYKAYENKPPTDIMGRTKHDFLSQATEFLTSVKGVNKTDVTTLLSKFKTLKGIIEADVESLSMCAGIGPVKARRIINTFTTPFLRKTSSPQKHSITHTAASVEDMINELEDDSDLDT